MSDQIISVGVLETGRPPPALAARFPDYPAMVADWLSNLRATFTAWPVLDGALPEHPDDRDLWVITGSPVGAYEDRDWIPPLENFIRRCRDAGRPMAGICFGHQIIAQALGGAVHKSGRGWGLGVTRYPVTHWPELLGPAPAAFDLQAFHQDQVKELPEGAEVLSATGFCPNAILWYPGFALTVQGHPEFSPDYSSALLNARRGAVFPDDLAERALETQSRPTNADALADILRRAFFDPTVPTTPTRNRTKAHP